MHERTDSHPSTDRSTAPEAHTSPHPGPGPTTDLRIAELEARVAELTARLAAASPASGPPAEAPPAHTSRRGALRLAGAAIAGIVGVSSPTGRAAAAAGDALLLGAASGPNTSEEPTRANYTGGGGATATTSGFVFQAGTTFTTNQHTYGAAVAGLSGLGRNPPNGVYGFSGNPGAAGVVGLNDTDGGTGVLGASQAGIGVVGSSLGGIGVRGVTSAVDGPGVLGIGGFAGVVGFSGDYSVAAQLSNKANLFLQPNNNLGSTAVPKTRPSARTDVHRQGELEHVDGELWWCVAGGAPGVWRKISGPATAGAFHAITPSRVYDSRLPEPLPGPVSLDAPRSVSVAASRDIASGAVVNPALVPVGATAVLANVTVVDTVGAGFLAVNPGGVTSVAAATINWSSSGQVLNNGVSLTLGADRRVTIVPGGSPGASTHVVIDVTGYFL